MQAQLRGVHSLPCEKRSETVRIKYGIYIPEYWEGMHEDYDSINGVSEGEDVSFIVFILI